MDRNRIAAAVVCLIALLPALNAQGGMDDFAAADVTLSLTNLAPLTGDHYEGWLLVSGAPVSTGSFRVGPGGALQDLAGAPKDTFHLDSLDVDHATKFVLSIEPDGDTDPAPAAVKPLAGDLNAAMTGAALSPNLGGKSLSGIAGSYILATPSDGADTNERSGLWFLAVYGMDPPVAGLTLPDLNGTDWIYEGWVVVGGKPLSTGRFERPSGADGAHPYSAAGSTPPFPGEDFLMDAPTGLSFPTDLRGAKAVISIEPRVDSDPAPFQFKPLAADVPSDAVDHTVYNMTDAAASLPTGTVAIVRMGGAPQGSAGSLDLVPVAAAIALAGVIAVLFLTLRGQPKAPK